MGTGIGLVVLDFDQNSVTTRCLTALRDGSRHPEVMVVVNNGRETCTFDSHFPAGVTTVTLEPGRNLGAAGGKNLGLNFLQANSDVPTFMVLDNDTIPPKDFIAQVEMHSPQPGEVLAPIIVDSETGDVWSSGGLFNSDGSVTQLAQSPAGTDALSTDWAPSACLIMHRDTWELAGAFDEWMWFLFEDVEWCHRLTSRGGHVRVLPGIRLEHEPHQSVGGRWNSPERLRLAARNETVFRISVVRASGNATAHWLLSQLRLAARDLSRGRVRASTHRGLGLIEGLIEAVRRR